MNAFNRYAAILGLALASAQAQAVEFSLVSGAVTPEAYGNTYSATLDGLTLTASAWSATGRRGAFETAELQIRPGFGMGVCNRDEGIGCPDKNNSRTLDNKGAADLILFSFSGAVTLKSLAMLQFGGDSDLSVWAGTGAFSPANKTAGDLGTASLFGNASRVNDIRSVNLAVAGTYDWLAVAARIGQKNDFAMLQSLTVEPVAQTVPEVETWVMLLAGLGLVGFAVRRRA
jgi:hypothetical protein